MDMTSGKQRDAEQAATREAQRRTRRERGRRGAIGAQGRPRLPDAAGSIGHQCDRRFAYLAEAHD
jgi:hypothetical protein